MAEYIDRSDVFNPQTPLALKDTVWSVLTLDSQNRLRIVPPKFTDIFSNFTTIHQGEVRAYTNHTWTTRISGTVPSGHIYVIQSVCFGLSVPTSGTLLAIRLAVNNYDVVVVTAGSGSTDANRRYNLVLNFVMQEGETYAIQTYSTDTSSNTFAYSIHILDFTIS